MEPRTTTDFIKSAWWPAPVTLISCGVRRPNIWVVGLVGGPCDDPPMVAISPRSRLYSRELMVESGGFVVNFPTAHMVREMEYCGTNSGIEVDKWSACGFTPVPGTEVNAPLIAECPVNLECTIASTVEFMRDDGSPGEQQMMLGRIVAVHAHSRYVVDGDIQWDMIDTIFRARPRTWRTLGPVLGYDRRKGPLAKPEEGAELVERRVETLDQLADTIRAVPYPTQVG